MLTSTQIPAKSLSQFLQTYESPKPSSFDGGHEVRYIPIYFFGICQHRRRLPQRKKLKMAARVILRHRHCPSRQLNLKTRIIKPTLNPMRPQLPSHMDALFVIAHSPVSKNETDTSNRTFRIRFFAHPLIVPGRVVVNGTFKSTGEKNI